MPVTAKFSKEFYDRLGHEVTDELVNWLNQVDATYRGELRELNDLNFQRFDAKLEQRVMQMEAKWDQRLNQLEARWDQRFVVLERRINELDAKVDQGLARLEARLTWRLFLFWIGTLGTLIALLKL